MCSVLHLRVALADKPMDNALCNNYTGATSRKKPKANFTAAVFLIS
jgi:hypothetical protein